MSFVLFLAVIWCAFAVVAMSLDLLIRDLGLFALAQAAFFGIGAYAASLWWTKVNAEFTGGLLVACLAASLCSLLVSLPASRLSGETFVVVTIALQISAAALFNNLEVFGGSQGLAGIPGPTVGGLELDGLVPQLLLGLLVLSGAVLVIHRIRRAPFGVALRAIRDDAPAAAACGHDPKKVRVVAVAWSAALAGAGGAYYASLLGYIDASQFGLEETFLIFSMVVLGSVAGLSGPMLGAAVFVLIPEALRFVGFKGAASGHLRLVVFGLLLILIAASQREVSLVKEAGGE